MGIRRALGAAYGDIMKQVLLESTLLAAAGGLLGLLVALSLLRALFVMPPADLPRLDMIRLEGAPITVAALVTVVAVLLFGLGRRSQRPGLIRRRSSASRPAPGDNRGAAAGSATRWLAHRSRLRSSCSPARPPNAKPRPPSAARSRLLERRRVADPCSLPTRLGGNQREVLALHEQIVAKFRALPGISAPTPLFMPPFVGEGFNVAIEVEGHPGWRGRRTSRWNRSGRTTSRPSAYRSGAGEVSPTPTATGLRRSCW